MGVSPESDRRRVTRWAWVLVATVPLAALASYVLLVFIALSWCGVSGCSGGGFGIVSDPSEVSAFSSAALGALVWFAALGAPPWLRPTRLRLTVAAVAAVAIAILMLAVGTGGFVRA